MIPARKKQTSSAHPAHCQARLQTSAEESGNLTKDMSETRKDMLDSAESVRLKLGTQTLGRKEMGREGLMEGQMGHLWHALNVDGNNIEIIT